MLESCEKEEFTGGGSPIGHASHSRRVLCEMELVKGRIQAPA